MADFLILERGGVRWQVRPELEHLFGPAGLRLDEWLAAGQAHIVKHGPHRTVYRVVLPGLDFYLKHNRLADYRARLREMVRPSKARTEYEHARAVAARQVPTFEPLALGEPCRGSARDSFLITRALPETRPLQSFLETTLPQWPTPRQTRLRQRLAVALARMLAHMHNAGIAHHDLHPGNLLLRLDARDRIELFLIDLHAVRIGAPLSWHARRANLILLNRWFSLRSQRTDRLRFWRVYQSNPSRKRKSPFQKLFPRLTQPWHTRKTVCATAVSAVDPRYQSTSGTDSKRRPEDAVADASGSDTVADLERGTLASNLRMWHKLDRRCLNNNRLFRRIRSGCLMGHAVADLTAEALAPLLADPDAPFEHPNTILLKRSPSSTVVEIDLPGANGPRRVVYKRFAVTRWSDPWAALFRRSPALRSYVLGHGLLLRYLPTPRPLAVWHRYQHGLPREGYLLTEKVADALDLRSSVDHLHSLPAAECRTRLRCLIDHIAHLLATLHQRRISHRDLKAANILMGNSSCGRDELYLLDLVGVHRLGKLRRSRRVQNLARLNVSFRDHPRLSRSDRLRFLRIYLRWGLHGRDGWKHWWRQIASATANKVRRNLRNGRPLG